MVYRVIAFATGLRAHLQDQSPQEDLRPLLSDAERAGLKDAPSVPLALLAALGGELRQARDRGWISDAGLTQLDQQLGDLDAVYSRCERVQRVPVSWVEYGDRVLILWSYALPIGLVQTLGGTTMAVAPAVAIAVMTLDAAGSVLEDPFDPRYEGIPVAALTRTLEADLRAQLGEEEPPIVAWDGDPSKDDEAPEDGEASEDDEMPEDGEASEDPEVAQGEVKSPAAPQEVQK